MRHALILLPLLIACGTEAADAVADHDDVYDTGALTFDGSEDTPQDSLQIPERDSEDDAGAPPSVDTTNETGRKEDPRATACHDDVADWESEWSGIEAEVLELTNVARAQGADCGVYGYFPPAPPVSYDPTLTCAARFHATWLTDNEFSHDSPGGDLGNTMDQRITSAGYTWRTVGENIAAGQPDARAVVDAWLDSDGHCANLMSPDFEELGVGYLHAEVDLYGHYWVQNFGTPM